VNIGLLSPFPPEKDGIALYSQGLLSALQEHGVRVTSIGRKQSEADYHLDFRSLLLAKSIKGIAKKEGMDILHIQYNPTYFSKFLLNSNMIACLRGKAKAVVTMHEVRYGVKGMKERIIDGIDKSIIRNAKAVIVHTPRQKQMLEKRHGAGNVHVIYHGLCIKRPPKPQGGKNLLVFGMISRGKGVPYAIRAMEHLSGFSLTVAGRFIDRRAEEEVKEALSTAEGNVRTDFGWISEEKKEQYYLNADIVILPHLWAPYQSGILHNAVSYGIPVVATKAGALAEMAEAFGFGEIVRQGDPKAIADGVRRICDGYSTYAKGIIGYQKEAEWSHVARKHISVFENVAKE